MDDKTGDGKERFAYDVLTQGPVGRARLPVLSPSRSRNVQASIETRNRDRGKSGTVFAAAALALAGTRAEAEDLQQKLAAAKQNAAQNQQALRRTAGSRRWS